MAAKAEGLWLPYVKPLCQTLCQNIWFSWTPLEKRTNLQLHWKAMQKTINTQNEDKQNNSTANMNIHTFSGKDLYNEMISLELNLTFILGNFLLLFWFFTHSPCISGYTLKLMFFFRHERLFCSLRDQYSQLLELQKIHWNVQSLTTMNLNPKFNTNFPYPS